MVDNRFLNNVLCYWANPVGESVGLLFLLISEDIQALDTKTQ
jgi:hypothetical protein